MEGKYDLREMLAALEHEQWSRWMSYVKDYAIIDDRGRWILDADKTTRWLRQMATPYYALPEQEKESDRLEADQVFKVLARYFDHLYNKQLGG